MNTLQANSCQENILVVDDTIANLDVLRRILSNNGYRVRPATNGNLALQTVRLFQPDLILLDIMMPEMNGYELCARLKADPATEDIPIIFLSALSETFDKVKAFEMGAMDYIPKPFHEQEVLVRVENILRNRRLERQILEKDIQLSQEFEQRKLAQESLQKTQLHLGQYATTLEKTNQQLEQTLEELQVAQEELLVQNEQLANSRMLIKREQQRYQNLFEFAPDGYVVTDAFGVIQEANQATAALLNQQQRFLVGKPLITFIPQSERSAFRTKLEKLRKRLHPANKWELNLKPKIGKNFFAAITIGTISDEQGKIHGFRWLIRDITASKEAEIARRTLQDQLQAILDNSPALIYLINSDNKYLLNNHQHNKLFNNIQHSLIGKSIYEVWPPEIADVFVQNNQKVLTSGVPLEVEEKVPREDGLHTYITVKFPLQDVNGVPYAVCGISTDITERKKEQEKIQQQKELLQAIFDHIPVMISRCDSQGQLTLFNRHLERVLGYSETEAREVDLLTEGYPDPEYRQQILDIILAANGQWYDMKTRTKEGRFLDTSWANIKLSDGSYIGIGQDITERKQRERLDTIHKVALEMVAQGYPLEEILLELTHQIAQLLPQIYAAIVVMDEHGQQSHVFVNPKLSPSFVLAMTPQKIAQNANSCRETADFLGKRLIVKDITTDPLWTEFKQLVLSHGLTAYWSEPILSGKGQFFGTFELYFRDARAPNSGELTIIESLARLTSLILERKHLEVAKLKNTKELEYAYYELKRTQARLIQSEKISSLGRMVAGIAHEINNPLSFIHGNLNHAKNYFEDLMELVKLYQQTYPYPTPEIEALISEIDLDFMVGDLSKLLSSMRVGTQRIADIVVSLKNFSRLDEQELKTVDIHEGIDSTLLILQHRLRSEGDCASASAKGDHPEIEVIKNYGQLPKFKCYVSQLNQVFLHILNNSIDALQNKSYPRRITISTEVSNEYCSIVRDKKQHTTSCIVIKIADNGHGMSEETQQRIFDPFFTTKPVGSGTGLGLAISHQIVVEKHRGQIRCISELGQKTEMIVELPLIMSNR